MFPITLDVEDECLEASCDHGEFAITRHGHPAVVAGQSEAADHAAATGHQVSERWSRRTVVAAGMEL